MSRDFNVMRDALVKIARQRVGYRSNMSIRIQSIAREALVSIGWDWHRDEPVGALAAELEAKNAVKYPEKANPPRNA